MSEKSKETAARYLPLLFFLVPIAALALIGMFFHIESIKNAFRW